MDRFKGAFLDADTTTDTEVLGQERDLVFGRYFDAELAWFRPDASDHVNSVGLSRSSGQLTHSDDGARLLALLPTFLGLALVRRHNGDTREPLILVVPLFAHVCYCSQ
jgi:hypothetical protein